MAVRVGINGFGRIGRNTLRSAIGHDSFEIVAINGRSGDAPARAHLITYDSVYGRFNGDVEVDGEDLLIRGKKVSMLYESDPAKIPWKDLGVDIVIESSGNFTDRTKAAAHLEAGAKKVIISAPSKNADAMIVMGVNEETYDPGKHHVISNASCTTNCLAPLAKVLDREFGIVKGLMTTVHAYTNDMKILDIGHKDWRRSRAAALSIIPTTTGAAEAVGVVLPQLNGKLTGLSLRVPVPTVSTVDLVVELKKDVTVDEVNDVLERAANYDMKGILGYCTEPLVSVDFKGDERSSIIDALSTMVMGGNMVKVISWYDNEWGYSNRVADLTAYIAKAGI
jgi:glyceraldehyde 3-phosphate dehydrogenase